MWQIMITHDKSISLNHQIIISPFVLSLEPPARAVTMVLCAPLTAGPWSAVTIKIISMNLVQYSLCFEVL
jgi:hypothetical protein